MDRKYFIKIFMFLVIAFSLCITTSSFAKNDVEEKNAFNSESTFEERTFDTKEVQGEELLGVPDPPDENGDPIDTPAGSSLIGIFSLLAFGSLIILRKNK